MIFLKKRSGRPRTTGCGPITDGNGKNHKDMKTTIRTLMTMLLAAMPVVASAQKEVDPEGYVAYSLPSTTLVLDVEAVQESFYAGPYARYAEKYLGIKPRQKDEVKWEVTKVSITPVVEADLSKRHVIAIKTNAPDLSFLKLTSAGLMSFADGGFAATQTWTLPVSGSADFSNRGVSSNLKSEATTLYRGERKETAYSRVSVQQNMVVEKTLEQKAAEAAQMIVRLREHRLQIVTGDTDATYSGEAMGAAVAELTSLEEEYMSLFTGYSEYQTQNMSFDIVPSADRESQMYVAFRISDTAGPVPADNLSGRPVVMEIVPQEIVVHKEEPVEAKPKKKSKEVIQTVSYLVPSVCTVKIKDGANLLIQSRIPVYQLGVQGSMPIDANLL